MEPEQKEVAYRRSLTSSEYSANSIIMALQAKGAVPRTPWHGIIATKIVHEGSRMCRTFFYEWKRRVSGGEYDRMYIEIDLRCLVGGGLDRAKHKPEEVYDSTEEGEGYAQEWGVVEIRMKFAPPSWGVSAFPKGLGLEL